MAIAGRVMSKGDSPTDLSVPKATPSRRRRLPFSFGAPHHESGYPGQSRNTGHPRGAA